MLTAITCTADRPKAFALCHRWMARQNLKPDLWIVSDGGQEKVAINVPDVTVRHLHNEPHEDPVKNFLTNLRLAIDAVPAGSDIAFFEDDDWYPADHLQRCRDSLQKSALFGHSFLHYWHVPSRRFLIHDLVCMGSLASTAVRHDALDLLHHAMASCATQRRYCVDRFLWDYARQQSKVVCLDRATGPVGLKGLPGRMNLSINRGPGNWPYDPDAKNLRDWIGSERDVKAILGAIQ